MRMCGIAGLIGKGARDPALIDRMTDRLVHRGPDDRGVWIDSEAGVALGHRRLAIVDLTAAGHEPMVSASGRLVTTFNGEVYNHRAIRAELERRGEGPAAGWRGHSDIETLLEAIDHWGLERALEAAVGMFAFALWDRRERRLHLVRDRFGEKPLYWGRAGRDFVFASELKAVRDHPEFDPAIDRQALADYAARCYVPAPRSIYRSMHKLEPGCILTLDDGANDPRIHRYYDYRAVVAAGQRDPFSTREEALDALDLAVTAAIDGQLEADVPVGAFLSGGLDSSTVTAVYQRQSPRPIRTYSIGFEQAAYDEAVHAKAVAAHLGTVHHEHYVTVGEARDVIPLLPAMYDEPFADSSQIPTYLVSRFARRDVTVALTGDGGDELFAGYNRHIYAPRAWAAMRRVPRPLRAVAGGLLGQLPNAVWRRAGASPGFAAKVRKGLALASRAQSLDSVYASMLDEWTFRERPVAGLSVSAAGLGAASDMSDLARLTCYDALTYLPDDILCKVDRASMAVSLETRVPFLDHRVAAVAARVPDRFKVAGGRGKQVIRDYLGQFVPPALIDRPKAGFALPIGEWLRGPMRDWAEALLEPSRLAEDGLIEPAPVRRRWDEYLAGDDGSTQAIWAMLMLQAWREGNSR
jgi:asparagine synthase (glutamine-hydrolysing)